MRATKTAVAPATTQKTDPPPSSRFSRGEVGAPITASTTQSHIPTMKLKPSGTFTVTAAPAPGPITVSFCLTKCDRHELVTLRDLFKDREARCLHLTGAVPLEYVRGIEAEAAHHGATARKIANEISRQDHLDATRRSIHTARMITQRAASAANFAQAAVSG